MIQRQVIRCKFLIQLGRYEELGSGVNNVTKYLPFYAPGAGAPSFVEDDMFTTVAPLAPVASEVAGQVAGQVTPQVTPEVTPQVTPEVAPEVIRMLSVLKGAMDRRSLQVALGLKAEKNFRLVYLRPALDAGLIEMTHPDKPRSSKQKYRLTDKGRAAQRQHEGERQ